MGAADGASEIVAAFVVASVWAVGGSVRTPKHNVGKQWKYPFLRRCPE